VWLDLVMSEREAAEVRALLARPRSDHPQPATVFIPGIMGSLLASVRGISAILWPSPHVLLDGHLNLLDLADDGIGDRSPDVDIVPLGIEKITYLQMILTLARETRLYEFPYDWRQSILGTAQVLASSLERWAQAEPERRFTLVCHSMGGLVARAYLALHPREAERRIARVIMLGTPLQGAAETALLLAGQAAPARIIRQLHADNDAVSFTANLPSAYQLLPPPTKLFYGDRPYPFDWDPYEASEWGLPHMRADLLAEARRFHEAVRGGQPDVEQVLIAGCHHETTTDVRHEAQEHAPNCLASSCLGHEPASGDGQVPLWSTRLPEVTTYYVELDHNELMHREPALEATQALVHGDPVALPTEPPPSEALRHTLESIPLVQQAAELRRRLAAGSISKEDLQRIFFAH
jgi:pimeloyl-ACP methyl ester carboxylesterase